MCKGDFPPAISGFGDEYMHDLLIALAFIGMVVAPAVVAAKSGSGASTDESR